MSQKKHDQIRSSNQSNIFERQIGEKISVILRQQCVGETSPMKKIFKETGIAPDTIKKWYTGRKPPRLGHFLILVEKYPAILQELLAAIGHGYLISYIQPQFEKVTSNMFMREIVSEASKNVPINVPINLRFKNLNERQIWFLTELSSDIRVTADDIVRRWNIKRKTARRDIAGLKKYQLIRFSGANKTGRYILLSVIQT